MKLIEKLLILAKKEHISMSEEVEQHQSASSYEETTYEPAISRSSTFITLTGPLPGGKRLTRPLDVKITHDDGEVIVSEPLFHIHAVGTTVTEALTEFRHTLSDELDDLTADEQELGARLQLELQYLRNLIRTA